jgi:Aminoglycoside-2''-adenylyltransferase
VSNPPQVLVDIASVMAGYGSWWALAGGWAVDAWLGTQTREHLDIDVAVLHADQLEVRRYLSAGWVLAGHDAEDDSSEGPWDGRRLGYPSHIHARGHSLELDFQLELVDGEEWLLRREPRVTLPLADAVSPSTWGLPTLAPEAVLFFKAGPDRRAHDDDDFRALEPMLKPGARRWLREALPAVNPAHA